MTKECFYEYITRIFYPWLIKNNYQFPIILYLDGHSSHLTLPLIKFCREKEIELIALFPHSTHIMQPLDIGFFHPLKEVWRDTVRKWKTQNNVLYLKKEQFPSVLKIALDSLPNLPKTIKSSFESTGLVPFNAEAVDYDIISSKTKKSKKNVKKIEKHNVESVEVVEISGDEKYLDVFEKTLSKELLQEFESCEKQGIWKGEISNLGLFHYWLDIKRRFTGGTINTLYFN